MLDPFFTLEDPRAFPLTRNRSDEFVRNVSSIIVMIASLDETRVVETLRELFLRARVPSRVYADVVQQIVKDWPECLGGALLELGHSARFVKVFQRSDWLEWKAGKTMTLEVTHTTLGGRCQMSIATRVRMHRMTR